MITRGDLIIREDFFDRKVRICDSSLKQNAAIEDPSDREVWPEGTCSIQAAFLGPERRPYLVLEDSHGEMFEVSISDCKFV